MCHGSLGELTSNRTSGDWGNIREWAFQAQNMPQHPNGGNATGPSKRHIDEIPI
jgi:hypothetical protein